MKQGPASWSELHTAGRGGGYAITCCSERASQSLFGHWHAFWNWDARRIWGGTCPPGFGSPSDSQSVVITGCTWQSSPSSGPPRQWGGESIAASNPPQAELVLAPRSWQALGWDSLLVDNGSRSRLPPAAPEHLFPVYSPFLFEPFLFAPFLFAPSSLRRSSLHRIAKYAS